MEIIEIAKALLEEYVLCNNCLGRQFALLSHGLTNYERGNVIKSLLVLEGSRLVLDREERGRRILESVALNGLSELAKQTLETRGFKYEEKKKTCHICNGTFESIEKISKSVAEKLSEYEYETFLIGVKISAEIEEKEDELRARFNIRWGESIRNEFSREIGKRISKIMAKTPNHEEPDIMAIVNPFTKQTSLEATSLYIAGSYKKLIRGIPQIRRLCNGCYGKGCLECGWTGKKPSESIEELITPKIKEEVRGVAAIFHAAGREGIDMMVLGSGRPFIVEIKKPKIRRINLQRIQKKINKESLGKIEVMYLRYSSKENVKKLKEKIPAVRVYRAIVEFKRDITDEELIQIKKGLDNKFIYQTIVRHSMKTRKKYLYEVK
ncbi:MAG: tRNA pseudouridine(54/55) synthase Pus10, partial [Candidatus Ranarchaeia archaeon]